MRWTVLIAIWIMLAAFGVGLWDLLAEAAGQDDPVMQAAAEGELRSTVAFLARVGLAHLFGGLLCGLAAAALARWTWPRRRVLGPTVCLILVFGWVYLRDVAARPVFYEPVLYQSGRVFRALMAFTTDTLSPPAIDVAALLALAALLIAGLLGRRRTATSRPAMVGAAGLVLVALVAAGMRLAADGSVAPATAATSGSEAASAPASAARPINLIWLGSDSLRADRLRALGYPREVLPHIDALAARGVAFRDAFVSLARTLPSIASLLTGCDPHTHGLRHMFPPRHRRMVRTPTLPRILRTRGYRSEVVTDYAGEMFNLVDLGFDAVHAPPAFSLRSVIQYEVVNRMPAFLPFFNHPPGHRLFPVLQFSPANADPEWMADRVLARLDAMEGQGPFFLMGFFSTTHTPYSAPWPGYKTFTDPAYEGPNKYGFYVRRLDQLEQMEAALPPDEVAQIRALYDGAGRMADAAIGRVIREVQERGLWENTIIVVFSDHGEHLYEPGNTSDHGKWFRGDEANRIPLVLAGGPIEAQGRIVDGVVRGIDVLPTLLGQLGIEAPAPVDGVDLGPRIRGEPAAPLAFFGETGVWLDSPTTFRGQPDALTYPSVDRLLTLEDDGKLVLRDAFHDVVEEAKHRCIRTDRWKLVHVPTRSGVRYELYDVVNDPANLHDVASENPAVAARLARRLRRWMLGDPGKHFDKRGHLVPAYDYFE